MKILPCQNSRSRRSPIVVLLVLTLINPVPLWAQVKLSLGDCIAYSLKNHRSATIYSNEIAMARQKTTEALAAYLPQVAATITFDDNIKLQTTLIPAGELSPTDLRITLGMPYVSNIVARVDQAIYDPALLAGLKANQLTITQANLKKEQNDQELITTTAKAYYQILILRENEKLLSQSETRYQGLIKNLQERVDEGVVLSTDLDRASVSLNNVVAQQAFTQTNLTLAFNRLKNAMGLNLRESIAINESLDQLPEIAPLTSENTSITNRLDYQIQQNEVRLREVDLNHQKATRLPSLMAYAQYGAQGYGLKTNNLFNLRNNQFDYAAIGFKLNVPIFSGLRKTSQLAQSKLVQVNAEERLQLNASNYQLEVDNFRTQLMRYYTATVTNRNTMELARHVLDTNLLRYQKGASGLADFLTADYGLKEAQSNYLTSLLDYWIAVIDYKKACGELGEYSHHL